MVKTIKLPVSIIRGGTSKGIYILEKDMPSDRGEWDSLLLKLMGSPDTKQIDGLGGAKSVTSKVAVIKKSERPDADVDYTFAQVSVDKPIVSYKGNCGNISSGVGPFAIEKGLVPAREGITEVRVYNTNTDKLIYEEVRVENGSVKYDGDLEIAGVPGTAQPIKLRFIHPSGTLGKGLLPTGSPTDTLMIPDYGDVCVSIVDAANPLVFAKAEDLGMTGKEMPDELDRNTEKLELLEKVRGMAAVRLGLTDDYRKAAWETPGIPKMTVIAEKCSYKTSDGKPVSAEQIDLTAKMLSMQKTHPSYAMTGAMCTAAAAVIPGTVVNELIDDAADPGSLRIGHPAGILECGVEYTASESIPDVEQTFGFRTANLLLEGNAVITMKQ